MLALFVYPVMVSKKPKNHDAIRLVRISNEIGIPTKFSPMSDGTAEPIIVFYPSPYQQKSLSCFSLFGIMSEYATSVPCYNVSGANYHSLANSTRIAIFKYRVIGNALGEQRPTNMVNTVFRSGVSAVFPYRREIPCEHFVKICIPAGHDSHFFKGHESALGRERNTGLLAQDGTLLRHNFTHSTVNEQNCNTDASRNSTRYRDNDVGDGNIPYR